MPTIYRALAEDFVAEGVDTHFALMGDGNMHWATTMMGMPAMRTFHARHEHCAVAMAMGYHSATGKVGVASVTCGPGFTQIMTALTQAARSRIPLVVFAGEVPMHAKWYSQTIDQAALTYPTGAHYIAAHSPRRMHQYVRDAFFIAHERRPVVLGVPYDLQKAELPEQGAYQSSSAVLPKATPIWPDPAEIDCLAEKLAAARFPILVAGRGAIWSGADKSIEMLADASGALLATTLPARGLYDHHPFSIGIAGGYAREFARELSVQADLVIAFGASLASHTVDGGGFFGNAEVVQVDPKPLGMNEGVHAADSYITADARLTAEALASRLKGDVTGCNGLRSPELARRLAIDVGDSSEQVVAAGTVDPRNAISALDDVLPKDFDIVGGSGHQSYFHSVMRGRRPEAYHVHKAFGAIGSGLAWTIGVAAARHNGRVVLFEGDGSLIMHIQEFEMIKRHRLKLLICILNDGAYGSEIHKLREDGLDDSGAIFGRTDFASIARGFGLRGENVTDVAQFDGLYREFEAGDTAMIWNIHISDQVVNPRMRKMVKASKVH
ncbi:thiamine pyrophosphate-binding protein [Corticibacterium sp. UT-5YL-CI-8]|nr:thiamine pyrophosphate-binding protein [Tianweitania sp. UT-5YL-CI-8]